MKLQHYINGQWVGSKDFIVENINPSDTNDLIGEFAQGSTDLIDEAVASAKKAQKQWQGSLIEKRQNVLHNIGQHLMDNAVSLGELLSREEGKPLAEGKGEVYRAGQFFTYYAAQALRQIGENATSVRPNIDIDVRREPMGVVAVISPWNFPVAIPAWKIAPAIAFGNAVVWKASNLTLATATALMEIMAKEDIPDGLINLVMGSGKTVGNHLVSHKDIDAITFTGSLATGQSIANQAAKNLTKLQMEMGSKNPLLVMDDGDLDIAVACAINSCFSGTGQKCTSASRLIIHQKVYQEFTEKFQQASEKLIVGNALNTETQMGPVIDEGQLNSNFSYIEIAKKEGCEIISGGNRVEKDTHGFYMQPTILANCHNDMRVCKEEMFAPITCLIKVDSYEQALAMANDTEFGLTTSIITQSLARSSHFKKNAVFGCVGVNLPTGGMDYHVPFGGRKSSSFGLREQGAIAEEFYTQVKTTYTMSNFAGNLD